MASQNQSMTGSPRGVSEMTEAAATLARRFAERAGAHDRDRSFPFENFNDLHRAGLLNLVIPIEQGGAGGGLREIVAVVGQIARGDASTALVLLMNYLQTMQVMRSNRAPQAVRDRVMREAVEGVSLINALRVEPELGTPARGGLPVTTATRTPDGWRLDGRKIYSTGCPILSYGLTWVRTADAEPLVGWFLVPLKSPGIRIEESWDHMGMRASGSHDVVFEDVPLPAEAAFDMRTPKEWAVRDQAQQVWNNATIPALYNGVACAARDWLVGYLHQRKPSNLGASLATLPRFQEAVGQIEALLATNRMLIDALTERAEANLESIPVVEANIVKFTVTNNAIEAVGKAMELIGNPGLSKVNPLERYYRDVLCSRIHTPQNDVVLTNAGRAALGL